MSAEPPEPSPRPGRIRFVWYAAVMTAYVVVGYFWKPVLMNWTLGPLFLLATLYVIPTLAGAVWSRLRAGSTT